MSSFRMPRGSDACGSPPGPLHISTIRSSSATMASGRRAREPLLGGSRGPSPPARSLQRRRQRRRVHAVLPETVRRNPPGAVGVAHPERLRLRLRLRERASRVRGGGGAARARVAARGDGVVVGGTPADPFVVSSPRRRSAETRRGSSAPRSGGASPGAVGCTPFELRWPSIFAPFVPSTPLFAPPGACPRLIMFNHLFFRESTEKSRSAAPNVSSFLIVRHRLPCFATPARSAFMSSSDHSLPPAWPNRAAARAAQRVRGTGAVVHELQVTFVDVKAVTPRPAELIFPSVAFEILIKLVVVDEIVVHVVPLLGRPNAFLLRLGFVTVVLRAFDVVLRSLLRLREFSYASLFLLLNHRRVVRVAAVVLEVVVAGRRRVGVSSASSSASPASPRPRRCRRSGARCRNPRCAGSRRPCGCRRRRRARGRRPCASPPRPRVGAPAVIGSRPDAPAGAAGRGRILRALQLLVVDHGHGVAREVERDVPVGPSARGSG